MTQDHPRLHPPFMLGHQFLVKPGSHEVMTLHYQQISNSTQVEPKMMEVLIALATANGKVVKKVELIENIWQNYGGAEDALTQAISKLRKVLGDTAKKSKVIQTIPKKGYRLILPVVEVLEDNIPGPAPQAIPFPVFMPSKVGAFTGFIERLTHPKFLFAFLIFSAVLIMVLGTVYQIVFWMAVG